MGRLVKLVGAGIGLAHESISSHRNKSAPTPSSSNNGESSRSAAQRTPSEAPPQYVEVPDEQADKWIAAGKALPADSKEAHGVHGQEEGDEEQWELDDAVEEQLSHSRSDDEPAQDATQLVDAFMRTQPPPTYDTATSQGLPCPVIIPQRRPRDKKRGFVRAYAPILEDVGIDQRTFLDFLKAFHQSSKSSPWLMAVNIAAAGAGMVPSPIAMGVSIGVQFLVGVAMEVQARTRTNSFLDRMNNEFFRPRKLYALIMTYKPDSNASHMSVDLTKAIVSNLDPVDSKMRQTLKNMRLSSGKTYGEIELPEAAPLIFPALDELAVGTSDEAVKKQNKLKSSQKFVADYLDRRAQARYAGENPSSSLAAAPQSQFTSRYSDPNHPASNGSLISLVTGGYIDPKASKMQRRERRDIRRGMDPTQARRTGNRRQNGIVKRILQKDVLYLMIVNMPSEEELQAGRQTVANEEAH